MLKLRRLLYPVSHLYRLVTSVRNKLYDNGQFKSFAFDRSLISVGNLAVGGTGKTPMVAYLIEKLKDKYAVATLSRGYGRKTKGFRIAGPQDSARTLGDEPYQYFTTWPDDITVAVGEDRSLAVTHILAEKPEVSVILLDDAFQHRRVKPQFQILLTTYQNPFWNDTLLPSGNLRENKKGAKRANALVITKCPANLSSTMRTAYINEAKSYLKTDVPILFSTINYLNPEPLFPALNGLEARGAVILVTGLANPAPLERYVSQHFILLAHYKYSDHHTFTQSNIQQLQDAYQAAVSQYPKLVVLTTQKDAMRLLDSKIIDMVKKLPIYYLPIKMKFLDEDEHHFWQAIEPILPQNSEVLD